jgi:hypothetical protein
MNVLKLAMVLIAGLVTTAHLSAQTVLEPASGRYFISLAGNDQWSGKLVGPNSTRTDGPFATVGKALEEMRKQPLKCTTYIRGGVYHLAQPLEIKPEDSGHKLEAYPGEKPVISGGLPVRGWTQVPNNNNLWVAKVPEVPAKRLFAGQFWLDTELQTRARYPNFDPANPHTAGWNFVVSEGPGVGAFGAVISRIHNAGDWVEWTVNAPAEGAYKVAFYYSAQNSQAGFNNMGGRTSVQVGSQQPVSVQNLPEIAGGLNAYQWRVVATVQLAQGQQTLRWTNLQGGFMNLDAIALSDDPAWNPVGSLLNRPVPGKQLVVIQAESFSATNAKDMVKPGLGVASSKGRFQYRVGDLKDYPKSPEAEIHIFPGPGWLNTIMQVRSIDQEKRIVTLQPTVSAAFDILPGNRYFVANVFEELDSPGEWYLDRASGNLYFWPPKPGFQEKGAYLPVLDHLIEFKGDPLRNKWVEEFTIKGMEFRHTTYSRTVQPAAANDAAIWLNGTRKCVLEGNRFVNLGGHAVRIENKSIGNEIVGNELGGLGEGGVIFTGSNATQGTGNVIAGNWIHHIGEVYKHVAGVTVNTGGGNRIANNLFEYLPRAAVSLKAPDANNYSNTNLIELNEVQFVNLETTESGAIETQGRHRKDTGNVIQYNRIRDTGGLTADTEGKLRAPYGTWGIRLDDYSSGTVVKGNVVVHSARGSIGVIGGKNNLIENNILVDGGDYQVGYVIGDANTVSNRFIRNIVLLKDPLAALFHGGGTWANTVLSQSDRNLFWHNQGAVYFTGAKITPKGNLKAWQAAGFDQNSMQADPMFMNATQDNFQPANASPAKQLGFEEIPFTKIGLAGFERAWKKK